MSGNDLKVIHVNFFSAMVDPVYFPQVEVVGDIANSVWQIKEKLTPSPSWDFSYFMKVREHKEAHLNPQSETLGHGPTSARSTL